MLRMLLIVVGVIAVLGLWQGLYKVDETELALVTQFGEIRSTETAPGLHFKIPFLQQATKLDKRVVRVDVPPSGFPDIESQFLDIDAYVRYRVKPDDEGIRNYREALLNKEVAVGPISQIAVAALREEIGRRTRAQIIGGNIIVNEDGTRTVTPILTPDGVAAREQLTRLATQAVQRQADADNLGIQVLDVRIKRADFPESIVESVYTRMRSERQVQAERLRAEGEQEFLTITANVDRQIEEIAADADRQSAQLRGTGEAEAITILASALNRNPEFYAFQRSLEAYAQIVRENSTLVLSANSPLFKYLQDPTGATRSSDE